MSAASTPKAARRAAVQAEKALRTPLGRLLRPKRAAAARPAACAQQGERIGGGAPANGFGLVVGTYNLLHPVYAEKYSEVEGVSKVKSKRPASNWVVRCPVIGKNLLGSGLDVIFLQEVGAKELVDLRPFLGQYDVHHVVHPGRSAGDGVAVLTRKERLSVINLGEVGFEGKLAEDRGQTYMKAATAMVFDRHTGSLIQLASVHFYAKKCVDPQGTLLKWLGTIRRADACHCVIWGGDCNKEYKTPPPGYTTAAGGAATRARGSKKIDWIFASASAEVERCATTEEFRERTACKTSSGHPPSDHYGEAVRVSFNGAFSMLRAGWARREGGWSARQDRDCSVKPGGEEGGEPEEEDDMAEAWLEPDEWEEEFANLKRKGGGGRQPRGRLSDFEEWPVGWHRRRGGRRGEKELRRGGTRSLMSG